MNLSPIGVNKRRSGGLALGSSLNAPNIGLLGGSSRNLPTDKPPFPKSKIN
jgi:hypothetical protein